MGVEKLVPEAGDLTGFIEQFGVFASAPGGIDKIKEMLLQLAVMGRLVENSLEDSASLLENLIAKKEVLIKSKTLRRSKSLGEIVEDEKRFLIPDNWVWARASDIYDIRDGTHDSPKYQENGFPLVTSKNIYSGKLDLTNVKYISEEDHAKISERSKVDKDDILFAMIGSIGNPVIIDIDPIFSVKNVGLFKYYDRSQSVPEFLLLFLKLAAVWMKEEASGAVQSFVSLGKLRSIPVPLPPLEEQKRIVAKVDELMALCNKLEAQQQQQANNVLRANTAAINALLNPEPQHTTKSQKTSAIVSVNEPKASFEQNWQRIAQHFNTLYGCTLPMPDGEGRKKKYLVGLENVKSLRKAIFKLAVTGKLTRRSQNNSTLELEKIRSTRQRLEKTKEIKKYNSDVIHDNGIDFKLPEGWSITRLGEITDISSGSTPLKGKSYYYENGTIPWITSTLTSQDYVNESNVLITEQAVEECRLKIYKEGTLLMAMYGQGKTRGQVTELRIPATTNQACAAISFLEGHEELRPFIKLVLLKIYDEIRELSDGGAQPNLNGIKVKATIIPLPPLDEQKRIVSKVDQLMTLCDQLEQQLIQSYSDAEKLMQSTVKTLVA